MYTYRLVIAYDGSAYSGWQRQDGFDTVQERLEEAVTVLTGESIAVHGAGRTDAGVHALGQAAHARLPAAWEPDVLRSALNGNLPRDIAVLRVRPEAPEFHARFSAVAKRYVYRFVVAPVRPVVGVPFHHWCRRPLDVRAMRAAARALVGRHDFASFASNPGYRRTRGTVRTVHHLHVMRRPHGVDVMVQGDGFLYNMVRTMAGTLRDVGSGKLRAEAAPQILAARDRAAAGPTLEPGGLFLVRVLYARRGGNRAGSPSGAAL